METQNVVRVFFEKNLKHPSFELENGEVKHGYSIINKGTVSIIYLTDAELVSFKLDIELIKRGKLINRIKRFLGY